MGRVAKVRAPRPGDAQNRKEGIVTSSDGYVYVSSPGSAALITQALTSVYDVFGAAGAQREVGPKLSDIFMNAGFPRPEMVAGQKVTSGFEPSVYAVIAGLARSLLPVMERAQIATAEEVGVDTLAERLRDEAIEKGHSTAYWPRLVGAWAQKA